MSITFNIPVSVIRVAMDYCGKEGSRPYLHYMSIESDGKKLYVTATDGVKLFTYNAEGKTDEVFSILVPAFDLKRLPFSAKTESNNITFMVNGNVVTTTLGLSNTSFHTGGDYTYPEWRRLFTRIEACATGMIDLSSTLLVQALKPFKKMSGMRFYPSKDNGPLVACFDYAGGLGSVLIMPLRSNGKETAPIAFDANAII